jgi:hypothetical protein
MVMSSDGSKTNGQPVSTGKFQEDIGLLNTSLQTLAILTSKQHLVLENSDEILNYLKERCSPENYQDVAGCFEILMKQPSRRALGRIRCVVRSLEEIKRHFVVSSASSNQDMPESQ